MPQLISSAFRKAAFATITAIISLMIAAATIVPDTIEASEGAIPFSADTAIPVNTSTASIRIATLLDKPERRVAPLTPDYCCFTVPDEFVVGYGLDYDEIYRNLPYIGVLKPEVYTK